MDYWLECVSIALEEAGVKATPEQLDEIARSVEGGHENYGMSYPTPESPFKRELEETKKKLARERDKVFCRTCDGRGLIRSDGPAHYSISQCWKCRGEGRHDP